MKRRLPINKVIQGDNRTIIQRWPDNCIDLVVTSPPYWGLRTYDTPPINWPAVTFTPMAGLPPITIPAESSAHGLEKDIWAYVAHEVLTYRKICRILAPHGSFWLNLGESYAGGGRAGKNPECAGKHKMFNKSGWDISRLGVVMDVPVELKAKDMCGIPWRVAFALQADGWYLRAACPWMKKNSMTESCRDRPSTTIEWLFLFSKSKQYYYDLEGVKIPIDYDTKRRIKREAKKGMAQAYKPTPYSTMRGDAGKRHTQKGAWTDYLNGRLRRTSDWFFESWQGLLIDGTGGPLAFVVNPKGYKGLHFAVWPTKLVTPMILASCPLKVCTVCGKPQVRLLEKERVATRPGRDTKCDYGKLKDMNKELSYGNRDPQRHITHTQTIGWSDCGHNSYRPGIVLDPYGGSGTTGVVAYRERRDYILLEQNPEYCKIAIKRLQKERAKRRTIW